MAPDRVFTVFIAVVTAWGLYEIAAMYSPGRPLVMSLLALVGGLPAVLILRGAIPDWWLPAVVIAAMTALTVRVGIKGTAVGAYAWSVALLGSLYVGVLFPYFALLRNQPQGVRLIIVMLLLVVVGDSGAYLIGSRWGRIKLAPRISPGKTVEGSIASIAASLVAMLLLRGPLLGAETLTQALVLALAINLLAQIGDLAESALKRIAGVKDAGWLFPGHGGLLDRTDSLVFATVFTYYYSR
jgi:phosphatidate cytidylyltransferase